MLLLTPQHIFAQSDCPIPGFTYEGQWKNYDQSVYINNCTKSQLDQLPNEAVLQFGEEAIMKYFSLSRVADLSTGDLVKFSNDHLIEIGKATNLSNFLVRFSNDRLLKFSNETLLQLPADRLNSFSCEVQIRLGRTVAGCAAPTPAYYTPYATPSDPTPSSENSNPSPSAQSTTKKPVRIIVEQFDQPVQTLDLSANLNEVKLKLNFDANGIANVKFQVDYDYFGKETKFYYVQYKLKQKQPSSTSAGPNEYLVDVVIHKSLPNQEEAANWATDTINNYINSHFSQAGIKHRLKLNRIVKNYDESGDCPFNGSKSGNLCVFNDNSSIKVWITQRDTLKDVWPDGSDAFWAQLWIHIPGLKESALFSEIDKRYLMHEIGHQFSLPDYYNEDVAPDQNDVVPIRIAPFAKDVMWNPINYNNFSEVSKHLSNRVTSIPSGYQSTKEWDVTPKRVVLKIVDENSKPIEGLTTEVFLYNLTSESNFTKKRILKDPSFSGVTDNKGEVDLKEWHKVKNYTSALLRITKDNKVRYMAITRSYLTYLYFQGQEDTAIITKKFSELLVYNPNKVSLLSAQKPILNGDGTVESAPKISSEEQKLLDGHLQQHLQQEQSSPSLMPPPPLQPTSAPDPLKLIDFNNDGIINIFDYIIFSQKKLGL